MGCHGSCALRKRMRSSSAVHKIKIKNLSIPQGEEPLDTGGGRVFSLDASFGLLATASASALALFLCSALSFYGVSCMI